MDKLKEDGIDSDDCRKAFEEWYSSGDPHCPSILRERNGCYRLMQAMAAWSTWQACWQNRTDTVRELVEALEYIQDANLEGLNDVKYRAYRALKKFKGEV